MAIQESAFQQARLDQVIKDLNQSNRARIEQTERLKETTIELTKVTAERDYFKKQLAAANEQLSTAKTKLDVGFSRADIQPGEALAISNAVISSEGFRQETRKGDILVTTSEAKKAAEARGDAVVYLVTQATLDELIELKLAIR